MDEHEHASLFLFCFRLQLLIPITCKLKLNAQGTNKVNPSIRPRHHTGVPRKPRVEQRFQDHVRLPNIISNLSRRRLVLGQLRGSIEVQKHLVLLPKVIIQKVTSKRPAFEGSKLRGSLRALRLLSLTTAISIVHMQNASHPRRSGIATCSNVAILDKAPLLAGRGGQGRMFPHRTALLGMTGDARASRSQVQAFALRRCSCFKGLLQACSIAREVRILNQLISTS